MSDILITFSNKKKILKNHDKYSSQLITRKWQIFNSYKNSRFKASWSNRESFHFFKKGGGIFVIGDPLIDGYLLKKENLSSFYQKYLNNDLTFLKKLDGLYLIVLIKKNELLVANSIFGNKNFFYTQSNEGIFLSTNQFILKNVSNAEIDMNGIAQRACFHTNYGLTFLKDTYRLEHDKILKIKNNTIHIRSQNRLNKIVINKKKIADISVAAKKIEKTNKNILNKLLNYKDKILISLSGGRDSRYILSNIVKHTKPTNLSTFSIGGKKEDEVRIAKEICDLNNIKIKLWQPKKLKNMNGFEKSVWDSSAFGISSTYKNDIINFLKKNYYNHIFVETNMIEIFLDDRKFHIEGKNKSPIINFLYSRKSTIDLKYFNSKIKIKKKTENIVKKLYSKFNFVKDPLKKSVLFDAAYVHSPWNMQASLTQFYSTNKLVSIAENIEMVTLMMNIDNSLLKNSKLYDYYNYKNHPGFFETVITRDIDYRLLNYLKLSIKKPKNLKFLNHVFIKNGALLSYLNDNKEIFLKYLKSNSHHLKKIFDKKFLSWITNEQKNGIPSSRIYKILCLILKKKWIRLYDILIPMSVIATLKNFEKNPYEKINPIKKNFISN